MEVHDLFQGQAGHMMHHGLQAMLWRRELQLEVEDNGPGVPETEREHVFEREVRGTEDGSRCRLGLTFACEIIERHHGSSATAGRMTPWRE